MAVIGDLSEAQLAAMLTRVRARMIDESTSIKTPATETATEIAGSAVEFIRDVAPKTPENIAREAAIRLGAHLLENRPYLSEHVVEDPTGTKYSLRFANHSATSNSFRHSGASALVARYIRRRGGLIGGEPVEVATEASADIGTSIMRAGFSRVIPHGQSTWRWAGTLNGVALNTVWTQPASFALWAPGDLMSRVVAVVLLRTIFAGTPGDPVNLEAFGEPQEYMFGNTNGLAISTPVSFVGQFSWPNDIRAILAEAR